jgi:predicted CXXCH cytochrome family protein
MKLDRLAILVGLVAGLGACTDEQIVYVNRPFNPPVDEVNGFLGYFDAAAKQTSCGNCHASTQQQWVTSAHADAWDGLQSSGGAQSFCNGCHTVSQLGNAATGPAGYTAVADESYHDVQCESCHGAGFEHASLPDATDPPLARLAVVNDSTSGTCGDCHSGAHHPFVEEWSQSIHALVRHSDEEECTPCHEGRGALEAWGLEANYIEHGDPAGAMGITCAVCHDPHGSANPAQLRFPLETRDPAQNLCMKCHLRRDVPLAMDSTRALSPGGSNSPHAPQGSSLIGTAGYQNPNYLDPVLIDVAGAASHGNVTKNPKLCAGCHVYPFRVLDTTTEDSVNVTGHLFRPIPCYGPNGVPTDTIKNCAYTPVERSFKPCAMSGCHLGENEPAAALSVVRGRIQSLTAELWVNSNGEQRHRHAGWRHHSRGSQGHLEREGDAQQPVVAGQWRVPPGRHAHQPRRYDRDGQAGAREHAPDRHHAVHRDQHRHGGDQSPQRRDDRAAACRGTRGQHPGHRHVPGAAAGG